MKRIIFRVNAGQGIGIGHLVRCAVLARELIQQGHKCLLVLGAVEQELSAFVEGLDYIPLNLVSPTYQDESHDAALFLSVANNFYADWVVVDDYYLGRDWELLIKAHGYQVLSIDDLCRPHECDILLDVRWRGDNTSLYYQDKLPSHCMALLGPEFVLLSEHYEQAVIHSQPAEQPFTLLVGLGGGGDIVTIRKLVANLEPLAKRNQIKIQVILGPLFDDSLTFIAECADTPWVEPLIGIKELYPHLKACDLYIGAAGGILYQLLALNKPALTFSTAENQVTPIEQLEDIGHFFHVDQWCEQDVACLPEFVDAVIRHNSRVQGLLNSSRFHLDGLGAQRVVKAMMGEFTPEEKVKHSAQCIELILSKYHSLRPVSDRDINHYLDSRNLAANAQNMINVQPIPRLAHYAWWFNTQRESYLLSKNGQACLYIWHQVRQVAQLHFLIGGWFVCDDDTGFQDALLALNWQLTHCDKKYSGIPWIAVIHRENKYVKLMNDYLGFETIDEMHPYASAIGTVFADAHYSQFFFVTRTTKPDPQLHNIQVVAK